MKSKRNKASSDLLQPFCLNLHISPTDGLCSGRAFHFCAELTKLSTLEEKLLVIQKIEEFLGTDLKDDVGTIVELLFSSLLQLNQKDSFRKNLLKFLSLIAEKHPATYYSSVERIVRLQSVQSMMSVLNVMDILIERKELVLNNRTTEADMRTEHKEILSIISEVSCAEIKLLWEKALNSQTSSGETNSIFQVILQIVKKLAILLNPKSSSCIDIPPAVNSTLVFWFIKIISSEVTPLDLRTSCGMLCVQMKINETDFPSSCEAVLHKSGSYESINDLGQIALFHGVVSHADREALFNPAPSETEPEEMDVGTEMLERLFHMINTAQIGSITVLGCRVLNHLMVRLLEYVIDTDGMREKSFFLRYAIYSSNARRIIDIIWLLWDHFLDSVKHTTRETFIVFIKVQEFLNADEALLYFTKLATSLTQSLSRKQSFSALTCLIPFIGAKSLVEANPSMASTLLKMLSDATYAAHSSNLLEALFVKHYSEADYEDWHKFWFSSFFDNFSEEMLTYGFEKVLKKLLLVSKETATPIATLSSSLPLNDCKLCLLIMCTKISLKSATNYKQEPRQDDHPWKGVLPFQLLVTSLESGDETLRILAFNLLCESSKSTELYDERELHTMMDFIQRNIASSDAAFRQKFINNVKKALSRINKGIASKVKTFASVPDDAELQALVAIHERFLYSLLQFLCHNVSSGSNFPRRSSSLLIMEIIMDIFSGEISSIFPRVKTKLFSTSLKDSLILCLEDSYEINKQIAMKLLKRIQKEFAFKSSALNSTLLESVWILASSSKPPDSPTASYLLNVIVNDPLCPSLSEQDLPVSKDENKRLVMCWTVLTKLQKEISVAQESLFKAAASGPMYGLLLCLRNLFENLEKEDLVKREPLWSDLMKKTISSCLLISDIVSAIVKNSSPEGHLPMDLEVDSRILQEAVNSSIAAQEKGFNETQKEFSTEELVKAQAVSAQMLLLCGWRNIKEVSLLFGFLIQGSTATPNLLNLLSLEDVESVGSFFLNQLTETKHRGAFEQAYNGFGMICAKLWMCAATEMNQLPQMWLDNTIKAIQDKSHPRLCATRRSAGVPFIIQAIISSEPAIKNGSALKSTMETLLKIAATKGELEARIHTLNILRTLYRDARIGEAVIPYVSEGVKAAVDGYKSSSWSVRNSSSLMFAALINRMLGVKRTQEDLHSKNAVSALVFFRRYPDMYDFFLENMKSNVEEMRNGDLSSSTFPSLLLLARLAPASSDGYSTSIPLTPFIPFVLAFSSSPVHHLRSLASKALVPLITPLTLVHTVEQLCSSLSLQNQNHVHGTLLGLIQIFTSFSEIILTSLDIQTKVMLSLSNVVWVAQETNSCLFTRACGIELFTLFILENILTSPTTLKSLTASCFSQLFTLQKCSNIPGGILAIQASTKLFLTLTCRHKKRSLEPLLKLLDLPSPEIQSCVLKHFLSVQNFNEILIQKIISGIKAKEMDYECRTLFFNVFSRIIPCLTHEQISLHQDDLNCVLALTVAMLNSVVREQLLAAIIQTSALIIQYKIRWGEEVEGGVSGAWVAWMARLADTDQSPEVRDAVARNCSAVLALLPLTLQDAGTFSSVTVAEAQSATLELTLVALCLDLLLDDDAAIQSAVSRGVTLFVRSAPLNYMHRDFRHEPTVQISHPPAVVVEALLFYLAVQGLEDHFTLLVLLFLKEDSRPEFGLSQEEDRAFEKGETKIFREEIHFSQLISDVILRAWRERGHSRLRQITINTVVLRDHLLFLRPLPPTAETPPEATNHDQALSSALSGPCSLPNFTHILKKEIEFVLSRFKPLRAASPFEMKNFGLWLERLTRRALLWKCLKEGQGEGEGGAGRVEAALVGHLRASLVQPDVLGHVLDCLS